ITFLRQKLKPPVGIEKPNLRHRAPPESICQARHSHGSANAIFFEVPYDLWHARQEYSAKLKRIAA
ncbi:MAG: hypothetical protein GY877_14235, partial [Hyphomicrobium sp.]|nr:hypothetical protein [Hyphomicrobium sp.]